MGVNSQRLQLTVTISTPTSQRHPRAPSINFVFVYMACLLQQCYHMMRKVTVVPQSND